MLPATAVLSCLSVMVPLLPVVKKSISLTTDSILATWKLSMHACRALTGSTSVTRAPAPRMAKALADVAVTADEGTLSTNHDIRCTHDAVWQGVAAPIVKLGLGDAAVHVDSGEEKLTFVGHFFEPVHTCRSLLAHTLALRPGVLSLVLWGRVLQQLQDNLVFGVRSALWIQL